MNKKQTSVLRQMGTNPARSFTRDELMSAIGTFVSKRCMSGLEVAGLVMSGVSKPTPFSLTATGRERAAALQEPT